MPQPGPSRGFTLLELLVVLVLLGIILSFAMLSIGDGGRQDQLEREARRLHALFHLAGEEAVLQSREFGVQIKSGAYSFVHYSTDGWQDTGDVMFRAYELPDTMKLQLFLDDNAVVLPVLDEREDAPQPQLLFFSSGERHPFELVLAYREGPPLAYRLQAPMLGRITLGREAEWQ